MAKYCAKCGKTLPDGVEICTACAAGETNAGAAAPFTRLTSETEIWKDNSQSAKRRTPIKEKYSTNKLVVITTIIVVLILGALSFVMTRPAVRVFTALNSDNYDKALTIFSEKLDAADAPAIIVKKLQKNAQGVYSALMEGSITAEEGEGEFAKIFAFTKNNSQLNETYTAYGQLRESRAFFEEASLSESNGDFLAASDLYKKVIGEDNRYAQAQEAIKRCIDSYAEKVTDEAKICIEEENFDNAIVLLKQADNELRARDAFSSRVDSLLANCFEKYEEYIAKEAANLAEIEEYDNAAALITAYYEAYGRENEVLSDALKEYKSLAEKQIITMAVEKSDEFYAQESYTEAFAELDFASENPDVAEAMKVPVVTLENRFASDMMARAAIEFDEDVMNAEAAAQIVKDALAIRELPKLEAYYKYLENLIPLDLNATTNCEKDGVIYRNTTEFECVDGTDYTDGWMWGENRSSVTYKLDGEYSIFCGVFAVRRAEGAQKQANFEVWLDGKLEYTSDILYATESKMPFEIDVTGVGELKIVFYANYQTSAAEGGYCCHGLCTPVVVKIPETFIYED